MGLKNISEKSLTYDIFLKELEGTQYALKYIPHKYIVCVSD